MNRKEFLRQSTILCMGLTLKGGSESLDFLAKRNKLGLQLFSIPKMLSEDFLKGIKFLSNHGYKELEFYGPYSFSADEAKKGWEGAAKMLGFSGSGLYGRTPKEVKNILKDHEMTSPGTHTDIDTLKTRMGPLAEMAHAIGQKYVTLPAVPDHLRKTKDDYYRIAESFNKIGESARKYGLRFGYHNHGYGIKVSKGEEMPLKIILNNTDPKLVFFEMDIFWTAAGGADPIQLLNEYPNRYKMLHIKDMKEKKTFAGAGDGMGDWMALFPNMASAGEGVLNVKDILLTAMKNGVEHFFVEQDMVANPDVALSISSKFVKRILK